MQNVICVRFCQLVDHSVTTHAYTSSTSEHTHTKILASALEHQVSQDDTNGKVTLNTINGVLQKEARLEQTTCPYSMRAPFNHPLCSHIYFYYFVSPCSHVWVHLPKGRYFLVHLEAYIHSHPTLTKYVSLNIGVDLSIYLI